MAEKKDSAPSGKGSTPTEGKQQSSKSQSQSKSAGSGGQRKYVRKDDLRQIIGLMGTGLTMVDAYDGRRVLDNTDKLVNALDTAQRESDAARRALQALVTGSTWGALASAFMPVVIPIAANHGLLPAETATLVGAPPPPRTQPSADPASNGQADKPPADTINIAGPQGSEDRPPAGGDQSGA